MKMTFTLAILLMGSFARAEKPKENTVKRGTASSPAVVRCYDPQGTSNPADKPYCEFTRK